MRAAAALCYTVKREEMYSDAGPKDDALSHQHERRLCEHDRKANLAGNRSISPRTSTKLAQAAFDEMGTLAHCALWL
jgi:hypothetical protein